MNLFKRIASDRADGKTVVNVLIATLENFDDVVELVRAVGGAIVKESQEVFWGGYHAYFADPDGYYWEVVWGLDFKYDEDGMLVF